MIRVRAGLVVDRASQAEHCAPLFALRIGDVLAERREPEPRRPSLGAFEQRSQRRLRQHDPGRCEQLARLILAKTQIIGTDLGERALEAQPMQAQPQLMSTGQHNPKTVGGAQQEQLQLAQRVDRAQLVQAIDHQPHRALDQGQILDQPARVQVGSRTHITQDRGAGLRVTQRVEQRASEPLWTALLALHRHPRRVGCQGRLADPRAQQMVFPLPAGADSLVTRAACDSRRTAQDDERPAGRVQAGAGPAPPHPSAARAAGPPTSQTCH